MESQQQKQRPKKLARQKDTRKYHRMRAAAETQRVAVRRRRRFSSTGRRRQGHRRALGAQELLLANALSPYRAGIGLAAHHIRIWISHVKAPNVDIHTRTHTRQNHCATGSVPKGRPSDRHRGSNWPMPQQPPDYWRPSGCSGLAASWAIGHALSPLYDVTPK